MCTHVLQRARTRRCGALRAREWHQHAVKSSTRGTETRAVTRTRSRRGLTCEVDLAKRPRRSAREAAFGVREHDLDTSVLLPTRARLVAGNGISLTAPHGLHA